MLLAVCHKPRQLRKIDLRQLFVPDPDLRAELERLEHLLPEHLVPRAVELELIAEAAA
jgi:hypothetical protein